MNKHRYKQEIYLLVEGGYRTADQIFSQLKKNYPNVWIGTVYRNLQELIDEKKIEKISGIMDKNIYEIKKWPEDSIHGHLVCENSEKVISIDMSKLKNFDFGIPEDFELDKVEVIFYGKYKNSCGKCKGKIILK